MCVWDEERKRVLLQNGFGFGFGEVRGREVVEKEEVFVFIDMEEFGV